MKTTSRLLAIATVSAFTCMGLYAQCVPDTVNCKDTGNPGQICPRFLPEVTVNVPYDEVITVLAPSNFVIGDDTIDLEYITVDSVLNLPNGIDYFANADKFYPDSAYCIQIVGTPTQSGEFPLTIYITPFVFLEGIGVISGGQIMDDTSVVMTVQEPSGINPYPVHEFSVLPNVPNPFSVSTRLGFCTPTDEKVGLRVYNILGKMVHEEEMGAPPGEHFFLFDGTGLLPGTYFYKVTTPSSFYTGKFIKSK